MEIRDADVIMTITEVAEYLRLGEATVYRLAQGGEIPGVKVGRSWRFKKGLIDEWFRLSVGEEPSRGTVGKFGLPE